MKIVRFKDGKYAIRRGWAKFMYQYYDLKYGYWWYTLKSVDKYCKGTFETVQNTFNVLTDHGEPIERI